uniref:Legume lectin domain-containing protein n=1 Tax=Nelumbo nucifera TaxID=4432 RepID=A0A822YW63_NELNU|nr:TPA_asm: hypothetical protein HUJ06_012319 [Nelumbo nucifera]
MDAKFGEPNGNQVGIDIDTLVSVAVSNVTSLGLVLNGGDKLHTWIDYDTNSKYLQVRLGKLGNVRPSDPLISYPIDLAEMWKKEEVFVGLSSSTGNSSKTTTVHSWTFMLELREIAVVVVHSWSLDVLGGLVHVGLENPTENACCLVGRKCGFSCGQKIRTPLTII